VISCRCAVEKECSNCEGVRREGERRRGKEVKDTHLGVSIQ